MNPHVAVLDDSDGDGLSTDAEILEGLNPAARDSDGDGGFDGYELEIGSNPRIGGRYIGGPKSRQRLGIGTDSDGDGLSDMTESGFGFSSKNRDTDFDGTSDYDELVLHDTKAAGVDGYFSRPQLPGSSAGSSTLDSDGDGLTDTVEYGLTPTHRADMDDDGLTDREERERGTNPLDADTDNDGYYDGFDDRPLTAGLSYHGVAASAPTDSDGDGLSDVSRPASGSTPTTVTPTATGSPTGPSTTSGPTLAWPTPTAMASTTAPRSVGHSAGRRATTRPPTPPTRE